MNATFRKSVLGLVAVAAFVGCSNDETAPEVNDPPTLPPVESMRFDVSFFENQARAADAQRGGDSGNFVCAVVQATFVNLFVASILHTPALAFELAINSVPTLQEDGSYIWVYTWVDDANSHDVQVRLRAMAVNDHVDWELRVTDSLADPALDQFLWFSGESSTTGASGFWVFNDYVDGDEVNVARVEWDYNNESDAMFSIESIDTTHEDYLDKLTYSVTGVMASIDYEDDSASEVWFIRWNETDGSGSIRTEECTQGVESCWDTGQQNTDCAPAS